jgi:SAM-dependent methyltransferase
MESLPPLLFDPRRRAAMRRRSLARGADRAFLLQHIATELSDRLAIVTRDFANVLVIGPVAMLADQILMGRKGDVVHAPLADEDLLPFSPGQFDLVLSAGTLDSVNDLPGALIQLRRILAPDGLLLATLYGAGSLATLKSALLEADGDRTRAHIHPQIDLKAMADLMTRAGFALPVCDGERLEVRYASWRRLVDDLRDAGAGNILAGDRRYDRSLPQRLERAWAARADPDGRLRENIQFLHISGWAPAPTQPKPARRGSGQISLTDLFGRP